MSHVMVQETIPMPETAVEYPYPLPVAHDWDEKVNQANELAEVIDAHLDYEAHLQGMKMRPGTLCPEQKRHLADDVVKLVR